MTDRMRNRPRDQSDEVKHDTKLTDQRTSGTPIKVDESDNKWDKNAENWHHQLDIPSGKTQEHDVFLRFGGGVSEWMGCRPSWGKVRNRRK